MFASAYNTATSRPALSVAERVVTTKWHPTWNLPLQRSEPGVTQWWNYDGSGRLLSDLRQATNDSNGATGLSATGTGSVTGRNLTYGATGLVTSSAEVLGFVVTGRWTYTYNSLGEPTRMSGTQGGLTSAADLTSDAHGQLTRVAGDSGALATFVYTARGRLDRAQLPDQSFNITRDARSPPTRIDTSAGTWLHVDYDASGIPTQVIDNTGTVSPVLGMGNGDEPVSVSVDRARSQRLGRHAWFEGLPLSAAQAQPLTVLSQIIGRGLSSALPASQQRPIDPLEAAGCCSGGQRSPSFQLGSDFEKSMAPPLLVFSVATSLIELSANDTLIWASAYRLRKNLACYGITKPETGCCHAHHIVHRNGYNKPAVKRSQAVLAAAGIGIDDWENGVYMSCTRHKETQNGAYDSDVADRLDSIPVNGRSRAAVGAVLREFALQLGGGC